MPQPRVLAIDDDAGLLDLIIDTLTDEGYEVITSTAGADALVLAQQSSPDVILLDLVMPGMSGEDFIKNYRQQPGEHAPIIVISAVTGAAARAEQAGARCFLEKPFDLGTLIQVIMNCVPSACPSPPVTD